MSDNGTLAGAALAFDANMGSSVSARHDDDNSGAVESMFGNLGQLDGDSPEAGGDALPDPKPRRQVRQQVEDEDEEDLVQKELYGDEDEDEDDQNGDENADEDEEDDTKAKKADEDDDEDRYEVMIDGERHEVGLREALDGYIRTKTFNQRMDQVNQAKTIIREEARTVIEQRQKYASMIDDMAAHLDALVPKEPDWAEEYKKDPAAAAALQKQYQDFNKHRGALVEERKRVYAEQVAEDEKNMAAYTAAENEKILNNFPKWREDPKVMQSELVAMSETAKKAGFTEEEVLGTKDSRMITILHKAMKYDRIVANRPKPLPKGKTPVKPGSGGNRVGPRGGDKAMSNLRRTGSVEDAAAVFANAISPPKRRR